MDTNRPTMNVEAPGHHDLSASHAADRKRLAAKLKASAPVTPQADNAKPKAKKAKAPAKSK